MINSVVDSIDLSTIKRTLASFRLALGSGKPIAVLASQQPVLPDLSVVSDSLFSQNHNLKKVYPSFSSTELICEGLAGQGRASSLDLACGSSPKNPFGAEYLYGVDLRRDVPGTIRQANLSLESIPFQSDLF